MRGGEGEGSRWASLERWRGCQRGIRALARKRRAWALAGGSIAALAMLCVPAALAGALWLAAKIASAQSWGEPALGWATALTGAAGLVVALGWRAQMWCLFWEMDCRAGLEALLQEERELRDKATPELEAERIEASCARAAPRAPARRL